MLSDHHALSARSVCFAYDGRDVLHDVSLHLTHGEVTAFAGPNGSGKSTLVELLAGVRTPRSGRILRSADVALVVQRPHAPDTLPLTVADTVAIGTWRRASWRSPGGLTGAAQRAGIADAIARVGLAGLERHPFADLSGGQRQRALIAQAIASRASILLLDEPAAGLDADSRRLARTILADEARRGAAVACVTHDDDAIAAADRIIRLSDGRIATPAHDAAGRA